MLQKIGSVLCLALCLMLLACGGTEIEKNPPPIVWGGITFAPETIERSGSRTIWNYTQVSGYGHSGTIGKVTINPGEVIVENLETDLWSAERQVWRNVQGDYAAALDMLTSGQLERLYSRGELAALPDVKIGSFESTNTQWTSPHGAITLEKQQGSDISLFGASDCLSENLTLALKGDPFLSIAQASAKRISIPRDPDVNPDAIVVQDLELKDLKARKYNATVGKIFVDYSNDKFKAAVDDASLPGNLLAELGLPRLVDRVEGSMSGEGEIKNGIIDADAALDLKQLVDISASVIQRVDATMPEKLTFSIKDQGILNHLPDSLKREIAGIAMFIPGGIEAMGGFLSKPGQTLSGTAVFTGSIPDITLKLN